MNQGFRECGFCLKSVSVEQGETDVASDSRPEGVSGTRGGHVCTSTEPGGDVGRLAAAAGGSSVAGSQCSIPEGPDASSFAGREERPGVVPAAAGEPLDAFAEAAADVDVGIGTGTAEVVVVDLAAAVAAAVAAAAAAPAASTESAATD